MDFKKNAWLGAKHIKIVNMRCQTPVFMFSDAAGYNFQVMYKASFGIHVLNHEPWQCCRLQVNDPFLKSTKVWLNSLRGCLWFFQNLLPNRVQLLTCLGTLCPECSALLSGKVNPMRIQTEPRRFKRETENATQRLFWKMAKTLAILFIRMPYCKKFIVQEWLKLTDGNNLQTITNLSDSDFLYTGRLPQVNLLNQLTIKSGRPEDEGVNSWSL